MRDEIRSVCGGYGRSRANFLGADHGTELDVLGNAEEYALNLRTTDLNRPWQSYRQTFKAAPRWETVRLPFSNYAANRTEIPLDLHRLRRRGIIGIGGAFHADVSIGGVRFFR